MNTRNNKVNETGSVGNASEILFGMSLVRILAESDWDFLQFILENIGRLSQIISLPLGGNH
jgi:hypothetical protein